MILEYKNHDGYIYAYITWSTVNGVDKLKEGGEVVVIGGMWIHPNYRNLGLLPQIINDMFNHPANRNAQFVLRSREKYKERQSKLIPVYRYLKYIKGAENVKRETGNTANTES